MQNIYIIAAKRTCQGKFLGALSRISATDLAVTAAKQTLADQPNMIDKIQTVIVGNVLSAGLGMNIARQIALKLNINQKVPAYTINAMCASGLQAIRIACQTINAGDANVILCGGTESMSNAPYLNSRIRTGLKLGDAVLVDSLLKDGLTDPSQKIHMGITAQNIADKFDISREKQDQYALNSHIKAIDAIQKNKFENEIAPLEQCPTDQHPRLGITIQNLQKLKPAFDKDGSITPGNASGINDGAAMLIVCNQDALDQNNWKPLAKIGQSTLLGCDPTLMGLGPIHAINDLLEKTNTKIDQYDHIELNEAFAAQAIACQTQLNIKDHQLNIHGGAIALGHPIGASGARLAVHLAHQCANKNSKNTLASLCVGGGMGIAMQIQSCQAD